MAYDGETTVVTFKRALAANGPVPTRRQAGQYMVNLEPGANANFIYAFGETTTKVMHGPNDMASVPVTLKSGSAGRSEGMAGRRNGPGDYIFYRQ
jgi:hypothetical protein